MMRSALILGALLAAPYIAAAEAQLSLSPSTGAFPVDEPFAVEVHLDTGGEAVNAAEGTITYNAEELLIEGIAIEPSIFTMWFIAPTSTVNGREGTIRFSGAVPAGEEFNGRQGRVMTITFRALRNVTSEIWFSQGAAVLAANGRGNNVLSSMRSGTYTLTERQIASAVQFVEYADLAAAPRLSSPTHPREDGWYGTATATVRAIIPSIATGVRSSLSRAKDGMPEGAEREITDTFTFSGLVEGVSYALIQYATADGWSRVGAYTLQVDRTPPLITAFAEAPRADPADPRVAFTIEAHDELSGLAWYEVQIGDAAPEIVELPAGTPYRPKEPLRPGDHVITIVARDHAGNTAATSTAFSVNALEPPLLEHYAPSLNSGQPLAFTGTTYPEVEVIAMITKDGDAPVEKRVKSDAEGRFALAVYESAPKGKFSVTFSAADARGATSPPSPAAEVEVRQPAFQLFGMLAISYLSVLIPLIALVAVLIILLAWLWGRARGYQRGVAREAEDAGVKIHAAFAETYALIEKQVKTLERAGAKRELTREEAGMLRVLSHQLAAMEAAIIEEVEDIRSPERAAERAPVSMKPEGNPVYVTRL